MENFICYSSEGYKQSINSKQYNQIFVLTIADTKYYILFITYFDIEEIESILKVKVEKISYCTNKFYKLIYMKYNYSIVKYDIINS